MKKLDSICSKLISSQKVCGARNADEDEEEIDRSAKIDSANFSSIRVNKRKNFTPRVVRTDANDCGLVANSSGQISDNGEKISCSKNATDRMWSRKAASDSSCSSEDVLNESNSLSILEENVDEEDEDLRSQGVLAIDEAEHEDIETTSGSSSTNRGSVFRLTSSPDAQEDSSQRNQAADSTSNAGHESTPQNSDLAQKNVFASSDSSHTHSDRPANGDRKTSGTESPVISYILRFLGNECGAEQCRYVLFREHFHCTLCNNKLFTKKEEMLRHYKWHRKREESLAHGFMRYSASDDCGQYFADCVHNLRQTHYHCLHDGCDKVYISTSDVQMHSNSHRKAAHIAKEGFQRVKASEQCTYPECPFIETANRTTHFHCLRPGCTHSFKNKADMDKHKAHHMRDEQLTRDGFKKFMKTEACAYINCAFSRVVNHIHCIRQGCDYVLHSTSQMYSHKRKHDKHDKRVNDYVNEQEALVAALKNAAATVVTASNSGGASSIQQTFVPLSITGGLDAKEKDDSVSRNDSLHLPPPAKREKIDSSISANFKMPSQSDAVKEVDFSKTFAAKFDTDDATAAPIDMNALQLPIEFMKRVVEGQLSGMDALIKTTSNSTEEKNPTVDVKEDLTNQKISQQPTTNGRMKSDDSWKKFITRYTANDPCLSHCPLLYKDHYHCTAGEGCLMTFKSKDGVRDHAKQHEQLGSAMEHFRTYEADDECRVDSCPYDGKERHFHCLWNSCSEIIGSSEPVFRRLEHHKVHEYSTQLLNDVRAHSLLNSAVSSERTPAASNASASGASAPATTQSVIRESVKRKRGRPPKYNVLDVNVQPATRVGQSPEIILSSFKLPKFAGLATGGDVLQTSPPQPVRGDQSQEHILGTQNQFLQSRRGRPRTVSSPRHPGLDDATFLNQQAAAAMAFLQQQQVHHFQQQLELLKIYTMERMDTSPPVPQTSSANASASTGAPAGKRPQYDGFTTYMTTENCPDTLCRYRSQLHFHCRLPRCFYSSNSVEQLNSHRVDFHEGFEIPDAYACYDRAYNCRHTMCQYNGKTRHFHCQTAGCSAALLKFNELELHTLHGHGQSQNTLLQSDQQRSVSTKTPLSPGLTDTASRASAASGNLNSTVRTSGIFYPTSTSGMLLPALQRQQDATQSSSAYALNPAALAALALLNAAAAGSCATPATFTTAPSTSASKHVQQAVPALPLPYTEEQQCGRPFCKLKRRLHFHCTICPQGFSGFARFVGHMQKHGVNIPLPPPPQPTTIVVQQPPKVQSSPMVSAKSILTHFPKTSATSGINFDDEKPTSDGKNAALRKMKFHYFEVPGAKKIETMDTLKKDQPGSISPKQRLAKKTSTLEQEISERTYNMEKCLQKLESVSSTDPPQRCADESCSKRVKSTVHYHCAKCEFWTPESTKLIVHIKQHVRMDQVAALGFQKVVGGSANGSSSGTSSATCPLYAQCPFTNQSHYHCVTCNFIALNQSQMTVHKAGSHPDDVANLSTSA